MKLFAAVLSRVDTVRQIFAFFWQRRLWWIIPMMIVLFLFGLLLAFAQITGIAPFIYTLF